MMHAYSYQIQSMESGGFIIDILDEHGQVYHSYYQQGTREQVESHAQDVIDGLVKQDQAVQAMQAS
jgi:hypothetical protein